MMLKSCILNLDQPLSRRTFCLIIELCCFSIIKLILELCECFTLFLSIFTYFIHFLPDLVNVKVKVIFFWCQIEVLCELRLIKVTEVKTLMSHTWTIGLLHFGVSNPLQGISSREIKFRLLTFLEWRNRSATCSLFG